MTYQIRRSVFETNSSSTHTLAISKLEKPIADIGLPKTITVDKNDQYGWEHETYNDTGSKISYLWLITGSMGDEKGKEAWNSVVALLLQIGVEIKYIEEDKNSWGGYIDHGGEAIPFLQELIENPALLYNFLFNNDSCIVTGNDNSDEYDDEYKEAALSGITTEYIFHKSN